ncbi:hypothetical protein DL96DRAFT_1706576 [Flagelloscypha sp. PMI_526]|nr:hypothetical protein DL96DRAFT_1706576 [Flagelloscypha sp. PMI_526]
MTHAKLIDLPPELLSQILEIPNCMIHDSPSSSHWSILRTASLVNRLLASVARPALFYHLSLPYYSPTKFMAFLEAIISSPNIQCWTRHLRTRGIPSSIVQNGCSIFADAIIRLSSIVGLYITIEQLNDDDGLPTIGVWNVFPIWFRQPIEDIIFPKLIHLGVDNVYGFPYGILFRRCLSLQDLKLKLAALPVHPLTPVTVTPSLTAQTQRPRLKLSLSGIEVLSLIDRNSACSHRVDLQGAGIELSHLILEGRLPEAPAIVSLFRFGFGGSLSVFEVRCDWRSLPYAGLDLSSLPFLETLIITFFFLHQGNESINDYLNTLAPVVSTTRALQHLRLRITHLFSDTVGDATRLHWESLDEVIVKNRVDVVILPFPFDWSWGTSRGTMTEEISAEQISGIFRDALPLTAANAKLRIHELSNFFTEDQCSACLYQ